MICAADCNYAGQDRTGPVGNVFHTCGQMSGMEYLLRLGLLLLPELDSSGASRRSMISNRSRLWFTKRFAGGLSRILRLFLYAESWGIKEDTVRNVGFARGTFVGGSAV